MGYPTNRPKFKKFISETTIIESKYLHNLHPRTRSCFIKFIISNPFQIWPTDTVASTRAVILDTGVNKTTKVSLVEETNKKGTQIRTCNGPIDESSSLYPQLISHLQVKEAMNEYPEDEEEVHSAHQLCTFD